MRSIVGCELCIGTAEELRYSCDNTNSIMNKTSSAPASDESKVSRES